MTNRENEEKIKTQKSAERYFEKGQWDKAIEEYLKFLKTYPKEMDIYERLGDVYVQKNEHLQAFKEYSKVSADLINQGQNYKTTEIFKKIAALDQAQLNEEARNKQNLIQLHLKADEAVAENKTEEAIGFLNQILKIEPLDFSVVLKLAQLFEVLGKNSDAVQQYDRMGEVFLKNRLFKKARETFKKITMLEPQNLDAHLRLGEIYIKLENEFDAKNEYHKAAEIALGHNDLHAAFEYSLKAVELKSLDAYYVLGIVLFERKKWLDAKMKFDDFLRFKPDHVGAQVYLGRVFDAMDQPVKAAEAFQKALKMDKENVMALEVWAQYCVKRNNVPEAIQTYNLLIEKTFTDSQDTRALEWAKAMVALDQNRTESKLTLARILEKSGDSITAAEVYFHLVLTYGQAYQTEEEDQCLLKTLELNPRHIQALEMNAKRGSAPPQPAAPAAEVQPLVVHPPAVVAEPQMAPSQPAANDIVVNPVGILMSQMTLAEHYLAQGLLLEAIDVYQRLTEAEPTNALFRQKLMDVYTAYSQTGGGSVPAFVKPAAENKPTTHFNTLDKAVRAGEEYLRELGVNTSTQTLSKLAFDNKARFEGEKKSGDKKVKSVKRKFV